MTKKEEFIGVYFIGKELISSNNYSASPDNIYKFYKISNNMLWIWKTFKNF